MSFKFDFACLGNEGSNSKLVEVDWHRCRYRPIGTLGSSQAGIDASKRLMCAFERSLRERFRVSVTLFSLIYGIGNLLFVFLQLLPGVPGRHRSGYAKWMYTLRGVAFLLCCIMAGAPCCPFWRHHSPCQWQLFRTLILLKALVFCAIELMMKNPGYGYIVFNQAFIYTFLPMHPYPTFVIALITWIVYSLVGLYNFGLEDRPVIVVAGLCFIQAFAHARRYNWMLEGFLTLHNIHHQKQSLAMEESDCDVLLRSMLPPMILEKLQNGLEITPEKFDSVTVLFAEICNFADITQHLCPTNAMTILNEVFTTFDGLTDKWGVYKVETVCQVYMAVAGCPTRSSNHAEMAANMALDMLMCVKHIGELEAPGETLTQELSESRQKIQSILNGEKLEIHIGLNSGSIRAGVVGIRNTRFKLFGDTVNTASRMESTCEPQHVQVSPSTHELLENSEAWGFKFEPRGEMQVKGKGTMRPFYLLGSHPAPVTKTKSTLPGAANDIYQEDEDDAQTETFKEKFKTRVWPRSSGSQSRAYGSIRADAVMNGLMQMRNRMNVDLAVSLEAVTLKCKDSSKYCFSRPQSEIKSLEAVKKNLVMFKRLALMATTDQSIKCSTLETLEQDDAVYRAGHFTKWVQRLRFKGVLVILLWSIFAWMDWWAYLNDGEWDRALHLSVAVRTGLLIPLTAIILLSSESFEFFEKYGQLLVSIVIVGMGMLVAHSCLTVYEGDPAYFLAFLLLYLDTALIRLRWRICSSWVMIIIFIPLNFIIHTDGKYVVDVFFMVSISFCFCLAVHGQEHCSHLSNFESRELEQQTQQLQHVQKMKWQLLTDLLPPSIAKRLLERSSGVTAEMYKDVTILFTDIKGFTSFSSKLDPAELATFLNSMYSAFDEVLERFGLHKVEVIGDAYFVVSGEPKTAFNAHHSPGEHAAFAAEAGLALLLALRSVCLDDSVSMRVGLHSGSVLGGVVGRKDPRFHLFGSTVELANRMEEYGTPGRVHVSPATHSRLVELAGDDVFTFEDGGFKDIPSQPKPLYTYFLLHSTFARQYRMQRRRGLAVKPPLCSEDDSLLPSRLSSRDKGDILG